MEREGERERHRRGEREREEGEEGGLIALYWVSIATESITHTDKNLQLLLLKAAERKQQLCWEIQEKQQSVR